MWVLTTLLSSREMTSEGPPPRTLREAAHGPGMATAHPSAVVVGVTTLAFAATMMSALHPHHREPEDYESQLIHGAPNESRLKLRRAEDNSFLIERRAASFKRC